MCGICGIAGADDKATVVKMAKAIGHRGPDASGVYTDKNISLAHKRLAIIDLSSRARQPMSNGEGTVWVSFNGEIYNFKELRGKLEGKYAFESDSDTEAIVHGFEEWGAEVFAKLKGDFAIALWSSKSKTLYLARDFPGVCPLYYHFDSKSKRLYFASEIKALLEAGIKRRMDLESFNDYLSFQHSLGPKTMFEGIFKVQPGELVSFSKGILKKRKFAALSSHDSSGSLENGVKAHFSQGVRRRLLSDVPLGVFLSGGLDSSLTAAYVKQLAGRVKTFSVDFGNGSGDDVMASRVASALDSEHSVLHVDGSNYKIFPQVAWHLDEPAADIAALPTFLMAREARKHVTVVLTGDGGDEVFGGYERYSRLSFLHKWNGLVTRFKRLSFLANSFGDPARARELMENSGDKALLALSYSSAVSQAERKTSLRGVPVDKTVSKARVFFGSRNFSEELMDFDLQALLPDDYLMKVNKMSLAHGLEARVPFLDSDLIAFARSIPAKMKVDGLKTKVLLRKVVAETRPLPKELASRPKQGFNVPTRAWLKGELGEIAAQVLSDSQVSKRGLFEKNFVHEVLEKSKETESLWGKRFWTLFALECWQRIYLDGDKVSKPSSFASFGV